MLIPVLAMLLLGQMGCNSVKRRIIVRTQPEGALVSIDRQAVGYSPVSVPFDYYGTRLIQLQKDGFETIEVEQRIAPPFYDSFPVSFFTENFALRERRDNRVLDFELVPKQQPNENELIERANRTRDNIRRGTITAPINR
jgi:hypothetical protein